MFLIVISLSSVAYAAQTVNNRVEIDDDDIPALLAGDSFGYQIESIGDLDGDGVIDLASVNYSDDSIEANVGSILILFMNDNGSVKGTNEIVMDATAAGLNGCIVGDSTNRDTTSLEQIAFVGDLDGDGEPTLALGANSNDHPIANSGAVYMLELNSDGTVDNCVLITEDSNNFDPGAGVYRQSGEGQAANFGWPVIATDLNGDGQNELIVGATSDDDNFTDLWPLFLTTTGAVSSHPATPVSGNTIGIDSGEYISDGAPVSGTKIVVSNENDGDGGGSVFIVNLSAAGAFVSATEIARSTIGVADNADAFGSGVAPLGDMDNDGINDILVGNIQGDDSIASSGEAYILYLNSDDTLKESQLLSNDSENTRLGAGTNPFANLDILGHGMALWRESGSNAVIAIGAHGDSTGGGANHGSIHLFSITRASSTVTAETGGDSDGKHKTKPTFGIDHKTNYQRVDDGLIINGEAFTVDDNFWTQIPMQYLQVGDVQNFTAKVYTPKELHVMEFLFGIPEVGKWDKAEASVAFFFDYKGDLEKIDWKNNENIVDMKSVYFSTDKVSCQSDDVAHDCRQVSVELEFKESPIGKVLGLQAIDHERRSNILYFNDGITLEGDSLNPPVTLEIMSEIKYKGLQTIQRIDKEQDIWITLDEDEPVSKYQQNSFGTFFPIALKQNIISKDKLGTIIDREHSEFYRLFEYEIKRAVKQFDSNEIQSTLDDSISSDDLYEILVSENYFMTMPKEHLEFYKIQDYEIRRALEQFDSSLIQAQNNEKHGKE